MRTVGAIVLAAGGSTRLGEPKQLVTIGGETLVRRIVTAATGAGCAHVAVVAGEMRERIANQLRETAAEIVVNDGWQRGLGTSIKRGLDHLLRAHPELECVILLACDQPFVDRSVIHALLDARKISGKPIVASSYASTLGIPALFDRSCFEALLMLHDETGAKPLIQADLERVARVEFEEGAIDIDTRADLDRLQVEHQPRGPAG